MSGCQIFMISSIVFFILMMNGFHQVKQGNVGIYKRFGVIQQKIVQPGYHFSIPLVEQFIQVKTTIQTDQVHNVPCGTSNGTLVYFDKIQVVNKLKKKHIYNTLLNYTQDYKKYWITDKIHHEINQFCSKHTLQQIYIDIFDKLDEQIIKSLNKDLKKWAPGIQILSVRVTKPTIPKRIKQNFQKIQRLKIDYFILAEKQKVKIQQIMTKQKQQIIKKQSDLDVKIINVQKKLSKKQNKLKMAQIQSQIIYQKQKTKIQTQFLAAFEQATMYPSLFTPEYMSYLTYEAVTANTTYIVGDQIPNVELNSVLV